MKRVIDKECGKVGTWGPRLFRPLLAPEGFAVTTGIIAKPTFCNAKNFVLFFRPWIRSMIWECKTQKLKLFEQIVYSHQLSERRKLIVMAVTTTLKKAK